jgi:hypothetical protein
MIFSKIKSREQVAMKVINSHKGKRLVYETYKRKDPDMAEKYMKFIMRNRDAMYISWDKQRKRFVA